MIEALYLSRIGLRVLTVFDGVSLALASPQYGGGYGAPAGGSTTSSSAAPAASAPADTAGHHNVQVGANGLTFEPANITASVGDLVTFLFSSSTPHSVTQSTFADPCTPLTGSNGTGFDSGVTTGTQFTINVTDASKPIWFFCKFPGHCGAGMVGSINAPSSGNTFDNFLSNAKQIGSSEPSISDSGAVTGGVGALATAGPTSASAPAPSSTGGSNSSGAGRIAVNGGVALVAAAVAFAFAA
ncbi:unnamed protein product [Somion occarium]|uniref:Blue (type 1) copper domain-containing protein n=1 Tax=Somion occarium TaxID=3059160 RepID=A0ABP1D8C3_9APHY